MYKLLFAAAITKIILFIGAPSHAQDRRIRFGPVSAAHIKYQLFRAGDRHYRLFGDGGVGIVARVGGSEEGGISFQPKLLAARENIGYNYTSAISYNIESINLIFNPEVLIPTRHERWHISAGIGVDWKIEQDLAIYLNNASTSHVSLRPAFDVIEEARRPLVPFITGGVLFRVAKRLHLQLSLRQDLRDAFPDGTLVTFGRPPGQMTVTLSHQATRLGLGIMYLF